MNVWDRSACHLADLRADFRRRRPSRSRGWRGFPAGGVMLRGEVYCRLVDPDNPLDGIIRDWEAFHNAATTVGLNYMLDTSFRGTSALSTWYVGLINGSGYSGVAAGDTSSSHSGWTEYQSYAESVRQTWSPSAAAAGVLINGTVMTFTNGGASASIQGIFAISNSTKGGTTGTLFATAVEASPRSLAAGAAYQVFYELDLTPTS